MYTRQWKSQHQMKIESYFNFLNTLPVLQEYTYTEKSHFKILAIEVGSRMLKVNEHGTDNIVDDSSYSSYDAGTGY